MSVPLLVPIFLHRVVVFYKSPHSLSPPIMSWKSTIKKSSKMLLKRARVLFSSWPHFPLVWRCLHKNWLVTVWVFWELYAMYVSVVLNPTKQCLIFRNAYNAQGQLTQLQVSIGCLVPNHFLRKNVWLECLLACQTRRVLASSLVSSNYRRTTSWRLVYT